MFANLVVSKYLLNDVESSLHYIVYEIWIPKYAK